jgi:uncharacterized membrane protein AbrB (regulator of aidB expression)
MPMLKVTIVIAISFTIAFGFIFNWANGIDYSATYASMMPIGIAFMTGVFALSSWGGVVGAYLDYKAEQVDQCKANHPAGKLI